MKAIFYATILVVAIGFYACSPSRASPDEATEFAEVMIENVSETEDFIYSKYFGAAPEEKSETAASDLKDAYNELLPLVKESIENVTEEKGFENELDKPYCDSLRKAAINVLNVYLEANEKEILNYLKLVEKGHLMGDAELNREMSSFATKLAKKLSDFDKAKKEIEAFYKITLK